MFQSNEKRFKNANKRIKLFIKRIEIAYYRIKVLVICYIDLCRSPSGRAFRFNLLQETAKGFPLQSLARGHGLSPLARICNPCFNNSWFSYLEYRCLSRPKAGSTFQSENINK